jgi:hypothetical protein
MPYKVYEALVIENNKEVSIGYYDTISEARADAENAVKTVNEITSYRITETEDLTPFESVTLYFKMFYLVIRSKIR